MKHQVQYDKNTIIEYEHVRLNTSNAATGVKYMTKLYLFVPPSSRYYIGDDYEYLNEDQVKILYEETLNAKERERDYGQRAGGDRKLLSPIRKRAEVGSISQRLAHKPLANKRLATLNQINER